MSINIIMSWTRIWSSFIWFCIMIPLSSGKMPNNVFYWLVIALTFCVYLKMFIFRNFSCFLQESRCLRRAALTSNDSFVWSHVFSRVQKQNVMKTFSQYSIQEKVGQTKHENRAYLFNTSFRFPDFIYDIKTTKFVSILRAKIRGGPTIIDK